LINSSFGKVVYGPPRGRKLVFGHAFPSPAIIDPSISQADLHHTTAPRPQPVLFEIVLRGFLLAVVRTLHVDPSAATASSGSNVAVTVAVSVAAA
jgi:hypothetical protein